MEERGEVWYIPGWLRSAEPEKDAWRSFSAVFAGRTLAFRAWDGDRGWRASLRNADEESGRLAREIAEMRPARRSSLILAGHSLGGRIAARALARIGREGLKIARAFLLAPAIPADDPDLDDMGEGSAASVVVIANPKDVTLKYLYATAGGESRAAFGKDGATHPLRNVEEYSCPADITRTTDIAGAWGRSQTLKRIANHHASFYFAELARILAGRPSRNALALVPQDNLNISAKVADRGFWWDVVDEAGGWKLERNIATGHFRIIDPSRRRKAWGGEAKMRESFGKVKRSL